MLAAEGLCAGYGQSQVLFGMALEVAAGEVVFVPNLPLTLLTFSSVAGRFTGLALEAAFYLAWWKSMGAPFRFGRFFAWIAGLSLIDAWALGVRVIARDQGLIEAEHIVAELGEVAAGKIAGRTDDQQITFFKSVGNAVQDVAVAQVAYTRARELGLGSEVSLT